MARSLIIEKKAGHLVPEAFHKIALEKFNVAMGVSTVEDGTLLVDQLDGIGFDGEQGVDLADLFKQVNEKYKESLVYFHLIGDLDKMNADMIQPFKLVVEGEGDDENVIIAAICDGDFPEFAKEENTNDFNMALTYLVKKINGTYEQSSKDLVKTLQLLDTATYRDEIRKMVLTPTGGIMLLANNGTVLKFAEKMTDGAEFPWGSVSQTLGYTEGVVETAVPVAKKKRTSLLAQATATEVPKPDEVPVKKKEPDETPLEKLCRTVTFFHMHKGILYARPDPSYDLKTKRVWWNNHLTTQRPNAEDTAAINLGAPASQLRTTSVLRSHLPGSPLAHIPKPDQEPKRADADVHQPTEPTKNVLPPVVQTYDQQKWADMVKAGIPLMDPVGIKEVTSKYPPFMETMPGMTKRELLLTPMSHTKTLSSHTLAIWIAALQAITREAHPDWLIEDKTSEAAVPTKKRTSLLSQAKAM